MKKMQVLFACAAIVLALATSAFTKKQAAAPTSTNLFWFTVADQSNPLNLVPDVYDGNGQIDKSTEMGSSYSNCPDQSSVICRLGYTAEQLNFTDDIPTSVKQVSGQYEQPQELIHTEQ